MKYGDTKMSQNTNYLLQVRNIHKSFGAINALNGVDINVNCGEIRGLIGENGSGKSTLSSIYAGITKQSKGEMFLDGKEYTPKDTIDAMLKGVSMIVQEQGTINNVSVAANIFLGEEDRFVKYGILNVKKMVEEAQKALNDIGANNISASAMIDELTQEDRKLVELARALFLKPKVLIIDETTTALSVNGRQLLYDTVNSVKKSGGAVLFISHDIEEIMSVCDSITILRDGNLTANLAKQEFNADDIRELMIGRELSGNYYRDDKNGYDKDKIVLEAKNLHTREISDINLKLHSGEILGIGGLSNCGIHDLGKVLVGLIKPVKGTVVINNDKIVKNSSWAVKNKMAYISKNRDGESMMPICSIKDNICLPSLNDISKMTFVPRKKEVALANAWAKNMQVKAKDVGVFCNTLSGGNKQKVVLAKWLAKGSDILIFDCPTRGIDVGTKAEIYKLMENLKSQGKSIVLISEELPELIGMSDRIIILKNGKLSGEFNRDDNVTESNIIQKMI